MSPELVFLGFWCLFHLNVEEATDQWLIVLLPSTLQEAWWIVLNASVRLG